MIESVVYHLRGGGPLKRARHCNNKMIWKILIEYLNKGTVSSFVLEGIFHRQVSRLIRYKVGEKVVPCAVIDQLSYSRVLDRFVVHTEAIVEKTR